ncbi:uncharacterized protein LY89DRAFT_545417, partial [Mollisia scopiformis]
GMEWATSPSVSLTFAQSSIETFCNGINSQSEATYSVPNTVDTELFLGAISQTGDPSCTTPSTFSTSDCTTALSNIINNCDTSSTSRKYGGVSATNCLA